MMGKTAKTLEGKCLRLSLGASTRNKERVKSSYVHTKPNWRRSHQWGSFTTRLCCLQQLLVRRSRIRSNQSQLWRILTHQLWATRTSSFQLDYSLRSAILSNFKIRWSTKLLPYLMNQLSYKSRCQRWLIQLMNINLVKLTWTTPQTKSLPDKERLSQMQQWTHWLK